MTRFQLTGADQGYFRFVRPHALLGVDQMMRGASMPVVASAWEPEKAVTGGGGLTTILASWQQTFDGKVQTVTAQPLLFYNLGDGFPLRSTGIASFVLGRNAMVPVGPGVPSFRIFVGVVVQIPVKPR